VQKLIRKNLKLNIPYVHLCKLIGSIAPYSMPHPGIWNYMEEHKKGLKNKHATCLPLNRKLANERDLPNRVTNKLIQQLIYETKKVSFTETLSPGLIS